MPPEGEGLGYPLYPVSRCPTSASSLLREPWVRRFWAARLNGRYGGAGLSPRRERLRGRLLWRWAKAFGARLFNGNVFTACRLRGACGT